MPCIGWRLIAELHRVLEDFQEAFDRIAGDGTDVHHEAIPVMSYHSLDSRSWLGSTSASAIMCR